MDTSSNKQPLTGRTLLIAPSDARVELSGELERLGGRVIECGPVEIVEPESYAALDDAIENLFGYDWLIFSNTKAVDFFLHRFETFDKEITELDTLRVCAIGEETAAKLVASRIHVDLVIAQLKARDLLAAFETFIGTIGSLHGLNFLIPRATGGRDNLLRALEEAGARMDVVDAYRAVLRNNPDSTRINALMVGGGIDCVVFTSVSSVRGFAQLFDTNDLSQVLAGVKMGCVDEITAQAAAEFGMRADLTSPDSTAHVFAETIAAFVVGRG